MVKNNCNVIVYNNRFLAIKNIDIYIVYYFLGGDSNGPFNVIINNYNCYKML